MDRIIGPEGEWRDEGAVSEHDEHLLRCLNAAANLYGVLTCDEFIELYRGCAQTHGASSSEPVTRTEIIELIDRMVRREEESEASLEIVDEVWCRHWKDRKTGEEYIVYHDLVEGEGEPDGRIRRVRGNWVVPKLRLLSEDELLCYEDPSFGEESPELDALADLLATVEEGEMSEITAAAAQAQMRVNGDKVEEVLDYIAGYSDYWPCDEAEYRELIGILSELGKVTRTWNYRGHTRQELVESGMLPKQKKEQIPTFEEVFGDCDEDDGYHDDYEEEGDVIEADDWFAERIADLHETEDIDFSTLPPAKYTGPTDFTFVKDPVRREQVLTDYRHVRTLTQNFVRTFVMHEMTQEERKAAFRRLGFDKSPIKNDALGVTEMNRDIVAGDFGAMMDDQNGEPAIRRLLTQGLMDERTRRVADYYENYRYTWLAVLAAKAGIGVKCRDLLTGDELFLMEESLSRHAQVKGMTVCVGIAPMGEVYLALGAVLSANFENPSTILKIVLTHLHLPTIQPIQLSFADQARFAAETIRRLDANGRLGMTVY